ncbi:Uncharacterized protein Rs2_34194 [Raphanus sativus]|nr:Uncharacterized protein Rs2_34194 [Raphanus sativus]
MKTTGSIVSVNSKSESAALSAPAKTGDQSGVTSGVVSSVKPAVTTSASSGPVNPAVNSGDAPVDVNSVKPAKGTAISSSPGHQFVKTGASSGVRIGVRNKSTVLIRDKGKSIVSGEVGEVMSFRDVTFGPHEGEVRFRLIHFWEAWNIQTKVLLGVEMLLIDEEYIAKSSYGESTFPVIPTRRNQKASRQSPLPDRSNPSAKAVLCFFGPHDRRSQLEKSKRRRGGLLFHSEPIGKTGVSSGLSIGDPHSKKPNGK